MIVGNPIRAAQRELGLIGRDALFATLLNVDEALLERAGNGDADARDDVVRRAALVLGIEPHELIFDGAEGRASTALFKAVVDPLHASAFEEAAHQQVQQELGRFVRRLRRKSWLRAVLGVPPPELPPAVAALARPTPPEEDETYGAKKLATRLRDALGLGDAPIPSMVALVRDHLRVEVRVTRAMWGQIDGASYASDAARGVLVNLRERPRPRSIRMTLAHELCHVLFDGDFAGAVHGGMLAFSPRGKELSGANGGSSSPAQAFLWRERRANAFAAYLIAPPRGVKALVGALPPPTIHTIHRVAEHFGLSHRAALNVTANVYGWKGNRPSLSESLEDAPPLRDARWKADRLSDQPLTDGELIDLADRAVAARRLLPAERDRYVSE